MLLLLLTTPLHKRDYQMYMVTRRGICGNTGSRALSKWIWVPARKFRNNRLKMKIEIYRPGSCCVIVGGGGGGGGSRPEILVGISSGTALVPSMHPWTKQNKTTRNRPEVPVYVLDLAGGQPRNPSHGQFWIRSPSSRVSGTIQEVTTRPQDGPVLWPVPSQRCQPGLNQSSMSRRENQCWILISVGS